MCSPMFSVDLWSCSGLLPQAILQCEFVYANSSFASPDPRGLFFPTGWGVRLGKQSSPGSGVIPIIVFWHQISLTDGEKRRLSLSAYICDEQASCWPVRPVLKCMWEWEHSAQRIHAHQRWWAWGDIHNETQTPGPGEGVCTHACVLVCVDVCVCVCVGGMLGVKC